jgi:uncharacterized protein
MTTTDLDAEALRRTMRAYRDAVRAHAAVLDRLNVYPVPDGDTGTNMARTLDSVMDELAKVEAELVATCTAISHGSLLGARGNSGVILSQLLRGMTSVIQRSEGAPAAVLAEALDAGARAAYAAVLEPVEGTILTVARAVAEAAHQASREGATLLGLLEQARHAGHDALASTPRLLPVLERAGVVDAGGAGYLLLVDALLHVVDGRPLPAPEEPPEPDTARRRGPALAGPRFEVMYLLDLPDDRIGAFRSAWSGLGDSVVVVGGGGTWTCHIHTDRIGEAVEAALAVGGRPHRIEVSDLSDTVAAHDERHLEATLAAPTFLVAPQRSRETTGVVAVAAGAGLAELFLAAGAQVVVRGGQTMNPSTAELLSAVEAVEADHVILLPNNGNVVASAEQVVGLSRRAVTVVRTRTVPEGLAAMVALDPASPGPLNAVGMESFADAVRTGEVTRAVRSALADDGRPVRAGDWIGIERGGPVAEVGASMLEVARDLLTRLIGPEAGLVTVLVGEGAGPAEVEAVRAWLAANHPRVAVEVHEAGRPLYPFTFGVE